jgi:hypothetical protein
MDYMVVFALSALLTPQEKPTYDRPDKLSLFSFVKSLPPARKISYCPSASWRSGRGRESYPGWQYIIDKSAIGLAHLLKQTLTKQAGWDLKFPDMRQYWQCNAVRSKDGTPD